MGKKRIIIILVFILIILTVGFSVYNNFYNSNNEIKINEFYFKIPEGYSTADLNKLGDVKISDGKNPIYFTYYNGTNITKYMDEFKNNVQEKNQTVALTNFKIDNLDVYKATIKETGETTYWYVENGNIYSVYSWSSIENFDSIFSELINSRKNSSF